MKAIGKMIKKKEKEYIFIMMETDMMVVIITIKKKEKEYIIIKMESNKWDIILMISLLKNMHY